MQLWESRHLEPMGLDDAVDLCRRCHRLAPFCFYNGNTFAAIGRTLMQDILHKLPPVEAHTLRSVVGHYIAGTIGSKELKAAMKSLEE